jgi:hypothetical protein
MGTRAVQLVPVVIVEVAFPLGSGGLASPAVRAGREFSADVLASGDGL